LFFYDIFWVFGTDVMVTVAKSFDAPIKLLFPKSLWAAEYQFSMLGLGDIVIPGTFQENVLAHCVGIFIALLLRYDYHRNALLKKPNGGTPYFNNTFVGYFVGLATTIFVMHAFKVSGLKVKGIKISGRPTGFVVFGTNLPWFFLSHSHFFWRSWGIVGVL
jgi:minor histocompatibility antigen H13